MTLVLLLGRLTLADTAEPEKPPPVRVEEVTLSGELGVPPAEAQQALRATRSKRILPAIPGVWKGWSLHAIYKPEAVDADLDSLRSFYYQRGYFEAQAKLDSVAIEDGKAHIRITVRAGPQYRIHTVFLLGETITPVGDRNPLETVCRGLLAERRAAERTGVLDFPARLEWQESAEQPGSADLTVTAQPGKPYRTGRIEFAGNRSFRDSTLRRALLIEEGAPLDSLLVRKSLARLNQLGWFEPVSDADVVLNTPPGSDVAGVAIRVRQKKMRSLFLSGPVGPMSIAGPLELTLGSRLPGWGRGLLELATYSISAQALLFAQPIGTLIPFLPNRRFITILSVQRTPLPGQELLSGFSIAPQWGWQGTVTGYAMSHLRAIANKGFETDRNLIPDLPVAVSHKGAAPGGNLNCELPAPKLDWARKVGSIVMNLAFSFSPF